jgi:ribose 5-phosphate isomerase A
VPPHRRAQRTGRRRRALTARPLNETDTRKRRAAERAAALIEDGMRIGLGTGSTARHVLDVIGERLAAGTLRDIAGVPTSRATEDYATRLGIPLVALEAQDRLDLAIDGADEVDPSLDLIKGLGGALLWEKIVESNADRLAIVVDDGKVVERLGQRSPVPVEVVPFAWKAHLRYLRELGAEPALRVVDGDGKPFVTDSGHYIVDCTFPDGVADPVGFEAALHVRPGIVETGLFLGMATDVFVAGADGVRHLRRIGT